MMKHRVQGINNLKILFLVYLRFFRVLYSTLQNKFYSERLPFPTIVAAGDLITTQITAKKCNSIYYIL